MKSLLVTTVSLNAAKRIKLTSFFNPTRPLFLHSLRSPFFFSFFFNGKHLSQWGVCLCVHIKLLPNGSLVAQPSANSMHVNASHFLCVMSATLCFPVCQRVGVLWATSYTATSFTVHACAATRTRTHTHTQICTFSKEAINNAGVWWIWQHFDELDDSVHCLPRGQQLLLTWYACTNTGTYSKGVLNV